MVGFALVMMSLCLGKQGLEEALMMLSTSRDDSSNVRKEQIERLRRDHRSLRPRAGRVTFNAWVIIQKGWLLLGRFVYASVLPDSAKELFRNF